MSAYVDTNVLARLVLNDIPEQAKVAERWLSTYGPGEVIVIDAALVELFFVFEAKSHYRYSRQNSVVFFETLLRIHQLRLSSDALLAFPIFKAHPELDFMDCLLAVHSQSKATNILTFDKELLKVLL